MSKKSVMTRIGSSHKEILEELAETYGWKMVNILNFLVGCCKKYKMLSPDWIDQIIDSSLSEYKKKYDSQQQKELEKIRHRLRGQVVVTLIKEYLKVLSEQDRKQFIENALGGKKLTSEIVERISNMVLIKIDGRNQFVDPFKGKPEIIGINPNSIIPCDTGYHITGSKCDCRKWQFCKIRQDELKEYHEKKKERDIEKEMREDAYYKGLFP